MIRFSRSRRIPKKKTFPVIGTVCIQRGDWNVSHCRVCRQRQEVKSAIAEAKKPRESSVRFMPSQIHLFMYLQRLQDEEEEEEGEEVREEEMPKSGCRISSGNVELRTNSTQIARLKHSGTSYHNFTWTRTAQLPQHIAGSVQECRLHATLQQHAQGTWIIPLKGAPSS